MASDDTLDPDLQALWKASGWTRLELESLVAHQEVPGIYFFFSLIHLMFRF